MINKWNDTEALAFVSHHQKTYGKVLPLTVYATGLLGTEEDLALHGGGNTSCKGELAIITGQKKKALFVKASGCALKDVKPSDFVALDALYLSSLHVLPALTDDDMADEFVRHTLKRSAARPSIETLMHAFITNPFIMHTHPTALLALTNRKDGETCIKDALGEKVAVIPYVRVGFDLATAVALAISENPGCNAVVIMHHGLVCFGDTVKDVYDRTIEYVTLAEKYLNSATTVLLPSVDPAMLDTAKVWYTKMAPALRGALSMVDPGTSNFSAHRILHHLVSEDVLSLLSLPKAKSLFETVPLTPDYLIRTRRVPLFLECSLTTTEEEFRAQLVTACDLYQKEYREYIKKHNPLLSEEPMDLLPRVLLIPGVGAVCVGSTVAETTMVADITRQSLVVKGQIFQSGGIYEGLSDDHLFDMEFRSLQRAKINFVNKPMSGRVALVTGSAGAIGSGICRALCEAGCNVVVTDLANDALKKTAAALREEYGDLVAEVPLDVTDPVSVAEGFKIAIQHFGGIDCVIVNAGIAHVAPLVSLDLEAFRKLEKVNVEGTLLILAETLRHCTLQGIGGDIVLISTKNVFAPGAQFGAYSATKAASHQLARIASLEAAPINVRVNMVAPDAVFSHGDKKSGLWSAVGPNRMKARGLDEKGLEDYYQSRNLLKAKIGADDVGRAVLFFVTRQTPTTGATIPVDGGLPDATPR